MKIALVTTSFLPVVGGAEFVVHHLANNWVAQGHDVWVFNAFHKKVSHKTAAYQVGKYLIPRGATRFGYHRFPWHWATCRSLKRALDRFQPEFISGHFGLPAALFLSAIKPECPWTITCHGNEISPSIFPASDRGRYRIDDLLAKAMNTATAAIAISQIAEDSLLEIGVNANQIKRIPNGVDLAAFQNESDPRRLDRLGINGRPFILSVGRNAPQKNFVHGLKAFASVAKRHRDLQYLICGHGCKLLASEVRASGLAHRVILSEPLHGADLLAAYKTALALVSSSIWEFSPLVILEAMAAGLPQVATNVPGTRDFVRDQETGFLVEPAAPESMAAAIGRLIDSESLRLRMKQQCLDHCREFDWPVIARKNLALAQTGQRCKC
jgi:glycosyltransferase involved in cell wall biosynthesis